MKLLYSYSMLFFDKKQSYHICLCWNLGFYSCHRKRTLYFVLWTLKIFKNIDNKRMVLIWWERTYRKRVSFACQYYWNLHIKYLFPFFYMWNCNTTLFTLSYNQNKKTLGFVQAGDWNRKSSKLRKVIRFLKWINKYYLYYRKKRCGL